VTRVYRPFRRWTWDVILEAVDESDEGQASVQMALVLTAGEVSDAKGFGPVTAEPGPEFAP
jgi:hypothetical protein